MSKDTITVSMNVYDIPIVIEALDEANKEIERLNNIIKEVREYIEWHYDLAADENVEFCLLRDRVLKILKGVDKE